MEQPELLQRVIERTSELVAATDDAHLSRPTPCADWNVKGLINHMAITLRYSSAVVDGREPEEDRLADDDVLGSDWRSAFARSSDAAVASFSSPGAMERVVAGPVGEMPGGMWASFPTWDLHVHAWDLAVATGRSLDWPVEVTKAVQSWADQVFGGAREGDDSLGAPIAVADGASATDHLVAMFGRDPAKWSAN